MWWAMAGHTTLPRSLSPETVHAHDLLFAPLLERLADAVVPRLNVVRGQRTHTQRFGEVVATSALGAESMIGAESGRRGSFSRDQYVPLTAHWRGVDGQADSLALYVDDTTQVDAATDSSTTATGTIWSDGGVPVVYVAGSAADRVTEIITFNTPPAVGSSGRPRSPVELRWPASTTVELTLDLG